MEQLYAKVLTNWHVISTLSKDEKLIFHADGTCSKDPYGPMQYISRRLFRRGLSETHEAIENLWETTTALVDLLLNHDALTQVQRFPFHELKEIEKKSYRDVRDKLKMLREHLQEAQQKGLKHLIETYNQDCKFRQLQTKSIDVLVKKIVEKLDVLSKFEHLTTLPSPSRSFQLKKKIKAFPKLSLPLETRKEKEENSDETSPNSASSSPNSSPKSTNSITEEGQENE